MGCFDVQQFPLLSIQIHTACPWWFLSLLLCLDRPFPSRGQHHEHFTLDISLFSHFQAHPIWNLFCSIVWGEDVAILSPPHPPSPRFPQHRSLSKYSLLGDVVTCGCAVTTRRHPRPPAIPLTYFHLVSGPSVSRWGHGNQHNRKRAGQQTITVNVPRVSIGEACDVCETQWAGDPGQWREQPLGGGSQRKGQVSQSLQKWTY